MPLPFQQPSLEDVKSTISFLVDLPSTVTRKFVPKTNGFINNVELTVTIANKVTTLF